jgi:hypothetical protein
MLALGLTVLVLTPLALLIYDVVRSTSGRQRPIEWSSSRPGRASSDRQR